MKRLTTYIILISLLTGCESFLDIDAPKDQLVTTTTFDNDSHANAAMLGLYISMNTLGNTSFRIPLLTGLYADELTTYASNDVIVQHYQNTLQPTDAYTNSFWDNVYNWIYQANAIIEGCESSPSLSPELSKQLMAEAYFIRAFCYFYLANLYGDVPLLIETDYQTNAVMPRSPVKQVYEQITADLGIALQDLNSGYVDGTGKGVYEERLRPNQAAAQALLSRVYLYNEHWDRAERSADQVIAHNNIYDTVGIHEVFLRNSREAIWQMQKVQPNTRGTHEGQHFLITTRPVPSELNSTAISESLRSSFELHDRRLAGWVGTVTDNVAIPSVSYYFPYKFKDGSQTSPTEYTTPLRLAEQYLIRAEARAQQGNLTGALVDLNVIRRRAGLDLITSGTRTAVLDAILDERRKEFFVEWGHRWLDLKRTGKADEVMTAEVVAKGIGGSWQSYKQLWPIPEKDVLSNPAMTQRQNPGYM